MTASVIWNDAALLEVKAAVDFVDIFDPVAANKLAGRLLAASDSLCDFPRRGREILPGIRQLSTVYPYLIRYRVVDDLVEILSVRHGARGDL